MIPYGKQDVTEEDIEAVVKVLRSDFLTQGPVIPTFEQKLCNYTGAKHAVAVNSCTSALHIACLALGLSPGDILWTSPITFVASANCALYCGAAIDFVDIEPDTALISVKALKDKLVKAEKDNTLPKIVIPVHFAGQPCDMQEIHALSHQYGFKIIEDAAHAIGARYKNEPVGNCRYSDIAVFSFHPVKIITTGEGGAAMTNSSLYAEKMELLRSHGITRNPVKMQKKPDNPCYYEQIDLGYNYRMTDIQAALGNSQMDRLDQYIKQRTEIAKWYDKQFKDTSVFPLVQKSERRSAYHLYVIKVNNRRNKLLGYLRANNIFVNLHYIPIYKHPYFYKNTSLVNAEQHYELALSLPIFPIVSEKDLSNVVQNISEFYENN